VYYICLWYIIGVIEGSAAAPTTPATPPSDVDMYKLFSYPQVREILPGMRFNKNEWGTRGPEMQWGRGRQRGRAHENEPQAFQYRQISTGQKISLVVNPVFLAEVQTCRLVKYLLDFDPRAKPFLTLIFYWARQNQIKLSIPVFKYQDLTHAFAPEPSALEWMVILFLCQKKIIPTPREILQRPHQPLFYCVNNERVDIGFSSDPQFAKQSFVSSKCPPMNTDEFFIELLQLAQKFFHFYGDLEADGKQKFLNTRDGELIMKGDLLNMQLEQFDTRLTPQELWRVRVLNNKGPEDKGKPGATNLHSSKIAILHPLIIEWIIMFQYGHFFRKLCFKIQASAQTLSEAIQSRRNNETGSLSLQTLLGKVNPSAETLPEEDALKFETLMNQTKQQKKIRKKQVALDKQRKAELKQLKCPYNCSKCGRYYRTLPPLELHESTCTGGFVHRGSRPGTSQNKQAQKQRKAAKKAAKLANRQQKFNFM